MLGSADDHSREEGAEREREPERLAQGRDGEPEGKRYEQVELVVLHPRNPREKQGHELGRGKHDRHEKEKTLSDRERDLGELEAVERTGEGEEDCQYHDGKVLDQGDPDHQPALLGVELATINEQPGQDHCARHGDHGPDYDALGNAPSHPPSDSDAERDGQKNAERTADDGDPLDLQELCQRELHSDRVHQQDHADFREQLQRVDLGKRGTWSKRTDQDAGQDISEDQRLMQPPRDESACDRREEHIRQIAIKRGGRDHREILACLGGQA